VANRTLRAAHYEDVANRTLRAAHYEDVANRTLRAAHYEDVANRALRPPSRNELYDRALLTTIMTTRITTSTRWAQEHWFKLNNDCCMSFVYAGRVATFEFSPAF
jgi:hypothetical protein